MPLTVLIVEDEQSASRLLAGIAQEVGLSTRTTGSAREALSLCAQQAQSGQPFSAVVLDLVLSELDGFQFGTAARAAPWGEKLPVVVVSGVYKQLPQEFASKVQPAAFFAKPFEPAALREALARLTGAVQAIPAMEGELAQKPAAALFVELLRAKATGVLTLSQDQVKRAVTFQQGMVRFAQSNVRQEQVGAAQVASGAIKQTSFDRAVALAKQQGIALHEALAAARVMTPDQLRVALKQQTADVCINGIAMAGSYRFEAKPIDAVSGVPDLRQSPVALVVEAAKRVGDAAKARPWLESRSADRMTRSPELEREMFALKGFWPGEAVTPVATGGRALREVLPRIKEAELPLLQFLCVSGLIALGAAPGAAPRPHPAAPAGAGDEDRGKVFTAQEHTARKMLFDMRDHLKDASHYTVLGVAESATLDEVKRAYFGMAKKFHSDSFSGMELGSARKIAEELFAKVNEANSTLTDKEKRAEYDVYLDRKAKGLPTDVGAILRAEGVFQKGELFFKAGRWEDAETQFREAIALNHAEAEFHAYLGMAIFKRTGKPAEGLIHVDKALELDPRLHSGNLFAVQLFEASGDPERAKTHLRKVIEKDPEFSQYKDELRRLKLKPAAEQAKGGFFSRLLKK